MKAKNNTILLTSLGHALELYDFTIFSFLAPVIAELFFPADNYITSMITTYGMLAIGLLIRPLGALVIGYFGDCYGRKIALVISIFIAAISTFTMGILPTYQEAGYLAPIGLIICRIFQGFSFGGEFAGGIIFTLEHSEHKKAALSLSILTACALFGLLLGSVISSLSIVFTDNNLQWRIPLLFGGVTAVIGYYIGRYANDTPEFINYKHNTNNNQYQKLVYPIISGIGLTFLNGALIYLYFNFLNFYFIEFCGFSLKSSMGLVTFGIITNIFLYPICGYLADKFGAIKQIKITIFGIFILSYPIFLLYRTHSLIFVLSAQLIMGLLICSYTVAYYIVLASLFKVSKRYFGFAISQGLGQAILGGLSPMIVTYFIKVTGNPFIPAFYLMLISVLSFIALIIVLKLPRYKYGKQPITLGEEIT